ncbi:hypothetical protein [Nocardioides aequoreus]|uniref:hypothetical protein n=1 Tax=Nocardioides aequoreus TaxID=397278 RepID=UPI0012F64410|nr:hypothetical protein [Nocardioides aequoreus]
MVAEHKTVVESLTVAVATFGWVAAPDWSSSPRDRRRLRLASLALTGLAGASYALRTPGAEPEQAEEPEEEGWTPRGATLAALAGGGVLATIAVHRGSERLTQRGAESLGRRGVRRPYSVMGLGWAALSLGLDLVERRTGGSRD